MPLYIVLIFQILIDQQTTNMVMASEEEGAMISEHSQMKVRNLYVFKFHKFFLYL